MTDFKFEDAMKRLEEIVALLEKGELSLEESIKIFEEGMKMSRICSNKLDKAEKRIEILLKDKDDEDVHPEPFIESDTENNNNNE